MHENRTKYPKKKTQMYQLLQDLPKKYNVTALVRMEKVRASQLLPLRKKLKGERKTHWPMCLYVHKYVSIQAECFACQK